jgi:hypothetical protein
MATPGHLPIKYDDDAAFDLPELAAHLVLEVRDPLDLYLAQVPY